MLDDDDKSKGHFH